MKVIKNDYSLHAQWCKGSQHTQDDESMLVERCPTVYDAGPTLN